MNPSWQAGVAAVVITPTEPMWLAGWAARRPPSSGTAMELFAKALALEDANGGRVVIVTADLIAIPRGLAMNLAAQARARWQLPRERLLFNASHTHSGPEVRPDKVPLFEIPPEFAAKIEPYGLQLEGKILAAVNAALEKLEPASLRAHQFAAGFAVNRRSPKDAVDHDVPVLEITGRNGKPRAILFGYACHNLTLPPSFCEFHGDYAGVAQQLLEETFPGTTALFLAGAGADQDPLPRGALELARLHGQTLADAIGGEFPPESSNLGTLSRVGAPSPASASWNSSLETGRGGARRSDSGLGFGARGRAVSGPLRVAYEEADLELRPLPSPETLQADLQSDDAPRRRKAGFLLAALAEKRALPTRQLCPVQVLRLGSELLLVALGGEPVADYARRFKAEFAGPLVWVAGYSNDMFGYLPTRRVLQEGGYEGGRSALWSALPTALAETAEERVVESVRRLGRSVGA